MTEENNVTILLLMILIFIVLFVALVLFITRVVMPFNISRNYILMEMERADTDEEYDHWKKELRKLYLRNIPFFGRFVK